MNRSSARRLSFTGTPSARTVSTVSCSFSPGEVEQAGSIIQKLQSGGVPAFIALERGARALRNALDYYNLKNSVGTH